MFAYLENNNDVYLNKYKLHKGRDLISLLTADLQCQEQCLAHSENLDLMNLMEHLEIKRQ